MRGVCCGLWRRRSLLPVMTRMMTEQRGEQGDEGSPPMRIFEFRTWRAAKPADAGTACGLHCLSASGVLLMCPCPWGGQTFISCLGQPIRIQLMETSQEVKCLALRGVLQTDADSVSMETQLQTFDPVL